MNYILIAPDVTSLMSKEYFIEVASRIANAVHGMTTIPYVEYSNGNYVLIGLLIEAIAQQHGDTLEALMQRHVFERLEMKYTYMSASKLDGTKYIQGHIVSANFEREPIETPRYPDAPLL